MVAITPWRYRVYPLSGSIERDLLENLGLLDVASKDKGIGRG
jgi:hypothetical protein